MPNPDGYMPDGTPVYIKGCRANGKSTLQLEIYRMLCGISDKEWAEIVKEFKVKPDA